MPQPSSPRGKREVMRGNIRGLILVSFVLFVFSTCKKEATLDETVGWLKSTLTRSYFVKILDKQQTEAIEVERLSDCTLKVKSSLGDSTETSNHEFVLALSELDPSRIPCQKSEVTDTWRIMLETSNAEKTVKHSYIRTGEVSVNTNMLAVVPININDGGLCVRVASAFSHAIKLCGGKPAPF